MRIPDTRSFPEDSVRFVEKKDPVFIFGSGKEKLQVFFRFSDVFRHHHRKIYPVYLFLCFSTKNIGRKRLAGSRRTVEEYPEPFSQPILFIPVRRQGFI